MSNIKYIIFIYNFYLLIYGTIKRFRLLIYWNALIRKLNQQYSIIKFTYQLVYSV